LSQTRSKFPEKRIVQYFLRLQYEFVTAMTLATWRSARADYR
jgi:hypothetical protein